MKLRRVKNKLFFFLNALYLKLNRPIIAKETFRKRLLFIRSLGPLECRC